MEFGKFPNFLTLQVFVLVVLLDPVNAYFLLINSNSFYQIFGNILTP